VKPFATKTKNQGALEGIDSENSHAPEPNPTPPPVRGNEPIRRSAGAWRKSGAPAWSAARSPRRASGRKAWTSWQLSCSALTAPLGYSRNLSSIQISKFFSDINTRGSSSNQVQLRLGSGLTSRSFMTSVLRHGMGPRIPSGPLPPIAKFDTQHVQACGCFRKNSGKKPRSSFPLWS